MCTRICPRMTRFYAYLDSPGQGRDRGFLFPLFPLSPCLKTSTLTNGNQTGRQDGITVRCSQRTTVLFYHKLCVRRSCCASHNGGVRFRSGSVATDLVWFVHCLLIFGN